MLQNQSFIELDSNGWEKMSQNILWIEKGKPLIEQIFSLACIPFKLAKGKGYDVTQTPAPY